MRVSHNSLFEAENDSQRSNERIRKNDSGIVANMGTKTIMYIQTDKERISHKVIYMGFAVLKLVIAAVIFASDSYIASGNFGTIFSIALPLAALFQIYVTVAQLQIVDEMTETMFDLAVKRFQILNLLNAFLSLAYLITAIIICCTEQVSGSKEIVGIILLLITFSLSAAMLIIEKKRKLKKLI